VNVSGCFNQTCEEMDSTAAAAASAAAMATVVVLGDAFGDANNGWPLCKGTTEDGCEAEMHDRTTIELPGQQVALVQALRKASAKPLICVLIHGGAVALGSALEACDGIVDLWVPGQMGGSALADVLLGAYSPAARAPYTFYSSTADLPAMGEFNEYPHDGSNGTTYRYYVGKEPAFRFGDGLSYTTFAYSQLTPQDGMAYDACDTIPVSVMVSNVGSRVSDEVVQVYVSVPDSQTPAPRIRLVAFERVKDIQPGTSMRVDLKITPESHAVVLDSSQTYSPQIAIEAGRLHISVGGSQPGPDTVQATVNVKNTSLVSKCH